MISSHRHKRGASKLAIILSIVGGVILLCCAGAFFFGYGVFQKAKGVTEDAEKAADLAIMQMGQGWDKTVADNWWSAGVRQGKQQDADHLLELYKDKLGSIKGHTGFTFVNINSAADSAGSHTDVSITCQGTFEKGSGTIDMTMTKVDTSGWKVDALKITSPALAAPSAPPAKGETGGSTDSGAPATTTSGSTGETTGGGTTGGGA